MVDSRLDSNINVLEYPLSIHGKYKGAEKLTSLQGKILVPPPQESRVHELCPTKQLP